MIELAYPLGLLALLALPVLVALYLLQPRRRPVVVSTVALWQAALRDREGAQGFRRLVRSLSLLLLLATAAAIALGLAGPQRLIEGTNDGDVVIVLDASVSMKTRSGARATRFDDAIAEASALLDRLPSGARALVMTSGRTPVLRSGFETDRAVLRRVLARLRASDEAGRPREALATALSLVRDRATSRIYFFTDGAFDPDVDPGSPQVVFRVVGRAARNVAIVRFDLRQEPAGADRFQVLLAVRNYTATPATVPASVRLREQVLFERRLELASNGEETLVLGFPGVALGPAVARIEPDDDLAADDQAFAAVNALPRLRVLLLGRGGFHLQSALEALPGVELSHEPWSSDVDLAQAARRYDVVVLDGVSAPRLPPGSFLLVDSIAAGLPFTETRRIRELAVAGVGESALVRHLDLRAVRIREARRIAVREGAPGLQRLFWSRETDLALALLGDGVKLVYLGFDPERSNFPLQAAFPLFVGQAMEWLRPRTAHDAATHVAAGMPLALYVPAAPQKVAVRMPSGESVTVPAKDGTARFDATQAAGIYRFDAGGATRYFAVTATDAQESDVNRRWTPRARPEASPSTAATPALLALWPYLVAAALGLLALEWCVWTGSRGRA